MFNSSSKTYESLGIKGTLNVYDDLENPKGEFADSLERKGKQKHLTWK